MKRFYVIDAMRIVLALCVAVGHAGVFPIFGPVGQPDAALDFLARVTRTLVFGTPPVIAFFVISGFCIHYPFAATNERCSPLLFYPRRYIRILVPIFATVILFDLVYPKIALFGPHSILWKSTLWSVLCEEIYYALYPLLNVAAPRIGWKKLIAASFAISIAIMAFTYPKIDYADIGVIQTSLILYPVWLLGCYLAENINKLRLDISVKQIWMWRFLAWLSMWLVLALHVRTPLYHTVTGVPAGILYFYWLRAEISFYEKREPWRVLVWGGRWSYSLYLVHPVVIAFLLRYHVASFEDRIGWIVGFTGILAASYLFYLFVERPSHRLARKIPLFRTGQLDVKPAM